MPGAGTDATREWIGVDGPVIVLVGPQLGENIGAAARAMGNFGLSRLRLVKPVQGWPNERARIMAAGADRVLADVQVFETAAEAVADCNFVIATTARAHDQAKPVVGPEEAARLMRPHVDGGETVAIMFGRERNGLENHEVVLADAILTLPVNPAFASLNLAQAVVVVAYEWFKLVRDGRLPFSRPERSPQAPKQQLLAFFETLERELEKVEFFRPPDKRETMQINLRNIFQRLNATKQDIQTLHGVIQAIAAGRKGPARGGILDGHEAETLRALIASGDAGAAPGGFTPSRGLARLLRRNPTDAERVLWDALTRDRRFAGWGFRRQVPVGRHIPDLVSFPLRIAVELVQPGETGEAREKRQERGVWLAARNYRTVELQAASVERDPAAALDEIAAAVAQGMAAKP